MDKFNKFIGVLAAHPEACEVAARLKRDGADLVRTFTALVVYIEGRSIAGERKQRGKRTAAIINKGVREHGVSPAVGRWLMNRAQLAHATNGLGIVHNLDSLMWAHLYLEMATGRRVSHGELAYLVQAASEALGRRPKGSPAYIDPNAIAHSLRRYRSKNARFIEILRQDIQRNL